MATLLDRQIRTNRTVSVTMQHARAIGDPIRSRILSMLYGQTLSAEEITAAVNRTGPEKALSTVRHHIDILRTTGLVEVMRIVESRGGITKYYGTSTRLLDLEEPENFESVYSSVIDRTARRLEEILGGVLSDIAASGNGGRPTAEYSAYLVVEIMNRAITKVLEKGKRRKRQGSGRKAARQASSRKADSRGEKTTASSLSGNDGGNAKKEKTGNG